MANPAAVYFMSRVVTRLLPESPSRGSGRKLAASLAFIQLTWGLRLGLRPQDEATRQTKAHRPPSPIPLTRWRSRTANRDESSSTSQRCDAMYVDGRYRACVLLVLTSDGRFLWKRVVDGFAVAIATATELQSGLIVSLEMVPNDSRIMRHSSINRRRLRFLRTHESRSTRTARPSTKRSAP
ncbi:hypothetical protein Poly24_02350 [Rosistilla carotiformis]|uniref:Uncharacterized protein n=1 Tax=Rosistilla carotiformis TaxID=2528017 RepID=A0A518JLY2_9BACT|nr:hypothetical protein Poly24_02350 [Rosistilla carotiformis]